MLIVRMKTTEDSSWDVVESYEDSEYDEARKKLNWIGDTAEMGVKQIAHVQIVEVRTKVNEAEVLAEY